MKKELININMVRETLSGIPAYALPEAFSLQWYQPEDERLWLAIHQRADQYSAITPELFERVFDNDFDALAQRQCYLLDPAGRAVGTATAWFDQSDQVRNDGRVHWVAILPEMQGQGLAKPLLSAVCERLRELGHERARLTTQPERIPAINLYLRYGFKPEVKSVGDLAAWNRVEVMLGRKIL